MYSREQNIGAAPRVRYREGIMKHRLGLHIALIPALAVCVLILFAILASR